MTRMLQLLSIILGLTSSVQHCQLRKPAREEAFLTRHLCPDLLR
jgi:hypothetical protein